METIKDGYMEGWACKDDNCNGTEDEPCVRSLKWSQVWANRQLHQVGPKQQKTLHEVAGELLSIPLAGEVVTLFRAKAEEWCARAIRVRELDLLEERRLSLEIRRLELECERLRGGRKEN